MVRLALLLVVIIACLCVGSEAITCPHQTPGLLRWSSTATWGGVLPTANANVVISGINVLLDESTPALASLTITNGALIWNNQSGIVLTAGYVLVNNNGSFIVGSESCLFTLKATISLTGTVASTNVTGFGSKFLGVAAGGTLELHGQLNGPAWTRLTTKATAAPSKVYPGGRGMNVVVFDQNTGATISTGNWDTYLNTSNSELFASFIAAVPAGKIVVINVQDEASSHLTENGKLACESVGSALIRNLTYRAGWCIIGIKGGAKGCCPEDLKNETMRPTALLSEVFTLPTSAYPIYPTLKVDVRSEALYAFTLNSTFAGSPIISVLDNTVRDKWAPGTQIIVTTTDSSYDHTELNTVVACSTCATNQIKLANPFVYTHWGDIESGVEMRAEVGTLTRNIVIQGVMSGDPADEFGAQTKFAVGFKNVHIEGVEYTNVGQHHEVGHYPAHWHLCGDVDSVGGYTSPTYFKNNAVHHSFNRCFSIHGTHGVYVYNNVAYDIEGHCYFLEDGIETRNVMDNNLGAYTKYGHVLLSDRSAADCAANNISTSLCAGVSTFWLSNPANNITNNVAAGSVNKGIWYVLPFHPTGLSATLGVNVYPEYTPLGLCSGNMAHSTPACFRLDDGTISAPTDPSTNGGITGSRYKPHVNSSLSNARVEAVIESLTTHHCTSNGAWVRGGQITLRNYASADNVVGMTAASEGTNPNDPGSYQQLIGGLFVGVSNNSDWSATYSYPVIGYMFYDGPHQKVNITFKNFIGTPYHRVAAFGTELGNFWQIGPTSNVSGLTFDNVSLRVYFGNDSSSYGNNDGMHNSVIHDLDGSLSRSSAGSWVVSPFPVHTINSCQFQPAWNASVCPPSVRYGQLFIANTNFTGTNFGCSIYNTSCTSAVLLIRDDKNANPLTLVGIPNDPYPHVTFQPLIMLNKTYTLHFPHPTPPGLQLQMTNWLPGEGIRIGICFPPATTFTVLYKTGGTTRATLQPAASLAALDATFNNTVYFWDSSVNVLFVKPIAQYARDGLNYCSINGCEYITITATGPNIGNINYKGICTGTYPKYAAVDNTVTVPASTYTT